jgi:hypothetical protein
MESFRLWLYLLESGRLDHDGFNDQFRRQLRALLPRITDPRRRASLERMQDTDWVNYILTARIEGVPSSPKQGRKAKGKGGGKGKGSFRLFARFGKGKNQDLTQLLKAWGKSCHVSVRSRVQDAKNKGQEVLDLAQAAEGGVPKVKRALKKLANLLNTLVDNCGACQTFLTATPGKCFGLATGVDPRSLADPGLRIEGIQVGFKVATLPPEEGHRTEICPRLVEGGACWRVGLMLEHDDGNGVDVVLLCGEKWLAEHGVRLGARVFLDMPEMGACGQAEVRLLELFAERIWAEPGRVTGTFRHRWGTVYELRIEGESKPIVVTRGHPFRSADRRAWVPVLGLRMGERLLARDGSTPRVESLALRAEPEPVYNIEVEGDHCYRVGQQGLLVHNASTDPNVPTPPTSPQAQSGTQPQANPGSALPDCCVKRILPVRECEWKICVYRCDAAGSHEVFITWPWFWPCPGVDPQTRLVPEPFGKTVPPAGTHSPVGNMPSTYTVGRLCSDYSGPAGTIPPPD